MDRHQMQFFPNQIQNQITREIRKQKFLDRPFTDEQFAEEIKKFDTWDRKVKEEFLATIEERYHLKVGKSGCRS